MNQQNMKLEKGRPVSLDGRLEKEKRCYELLDHLGVEYWRVDHAPAETIEACKEIDALLGADICKNLFLCNRQQTDFYLLMVPGTKQFKTKDLSRQIGTARLSFASAEHMQELLDITPGSVSVLGLMNDRENRVRLLVDQELLREEYIGCHPCINTCSLKIRTEELLGRVLESMHHTMTTVTLETPPEEIH